MNRTWHLGFEMGLPVEFTFSAPERLNREHFERLRRYLAILEQEYALDWPPGTSPALAALPAAPSARPVAIGSAAILAFVQAAPGSVTTREVTDHLGLPVTKAPAVRSALLRLAGTGRLAKLGTRWALPTNEAEKQEAPEAEDAGDDSDEEEPPPPTHQPVEVPEVDDEAEEVEESDAGEDSDSEEEKPPRKTPGEAARTTPIKKRCAACGAEKPRSAFAGPAEGVCRVCTLAGKRPKPAKPAAAPVLVCQWPKCAAEIRTSDLVAHMRDAHGKLLQARQALAFFRVPPPTAKPA